jgi:hypothetical protein
MMACWSTNAVATTLDHSQPQPLQRCFHTGQSSRPCTQQHLCSGVSLGHASPTVHRLHVLCAATGLPYIPNFLPIKVCKAAAASSAVFVAQQSHQLQPTVCSCTKRVQDGPPCAVQCLSWGASLPVAHTHLSIFLQVLASCGHRIRYGNTSTWGEQLLPYEFAYVAANACMPRALHRVFMLRGTKSVCKHLRAPDGAQYLC